MAWEDKTLKKNAQNEIVPQAFNDVIDDYEPVKSTDGALHNVLYGPNGLPIKDINNKLEVRSTELEALVQGLASEGKLEQARLLLESIDSKDMATNSTLEQARLLLASLDGKDFATDAELALVKSQLQTLETKLDSLATILTDGTQKVQQSGNIPEITTIVDAVAVTDSNAFVDASGTLIPSTLIDKYVEWDLFIVNTHDSAFRCAITPTTIYGSVPTVIMEDGSVKFYDTSALPNGAAQHLIPEEVRAIALATIPAKAGDLKAIDPSPYKSYAGDLRLYLRSVTAPTKGAITVKLVGRLR